MLWLWYGLKMLDSKLNFFRLCTLTKSVKLKAIHQRVETTYLIPSHVNIAPVRRWKIGNDVELLKFPTVFLLHLD